MSSTLSRILVSIYFCLNTLFFTGTMQDSYLVFSLIPIAIPYKNKCFNCNHSYWTPIPKWGWTSLLGNNTKIITYLLAILPSKVSITLLITYFPYTGLGRIVALPFIYLINTVVIIVGISITRHLNLYLKSLVWIVLLLLSIYISIYIYPQEDGPTVLSQILEEMGF
jgi:hypothetical protein